MNEFDPMQEKSWRKLTAAGQAEARAWLAEHPEARGDWEADRALTDALAGLPDAPVPGNFTSRVLQAVELEAKAASRPQPKRWFLRLLLPRAAVAAVIFGVGLVSYQEHVAAQKRAQLLQGVQVVAGVASLPSPEILQDFDTIRQMGTTPGPDPELIALMK